MVKHIPIDEELVAPCGMNCALCSNYLAYLNNLNKSQCAGCRPTNKKCSYLFDKCPGKNHDLEGNAKARFCFDCEQYPCKEIDRMDRRYRKSYGISVKENLVYIKENGLSELVARQYAEHRCAQCGGLVSVHNKKCFKCEKVTRLVEK
jgi:hypothetical protein